MLRAEQNDTIHSLAARDPPARQRTLRNAIAGMLPLCASRRRKTYRQRIGFGGDLVPVEREVQAETLRAATRAKSVFPTAERCPRHPGRDCR